MLKFKAFSKEINDMLAIAGREVPQKATIPALECFKITGDPTTGLTVTGYDLVNGVVVTDSNIRVIEAGEILVNAKTLSNIVKKIPQREEVTFEEKANSCKISKSDMKFKLPTLSIADYPKMLSVEAEAKKSITVKHNVIKGIVSRTLFSAGDDSDTNIQRGICFVLEIDGENIEGRSIDGYRGARRKEKLDVPATTKFEGKLSKKLLSEFLKLPINDDEDVVIEYDKRSILFKTENIQLFGRLYYGETFNFSGIKIDEKYKLEINTDEMKSAVDTLSPLTDIMKTAIEIIIEDDKMTFVIDNVIGSGSTEIHAKNLTENTEKIRIGVNINYLLENLSVIESETFILCAEKSTTPLKLYEEGNTDFILVPVRLKNNG